MERSVGACLVLRGGREFTFTAEGKAAVAAAEEIESIVEKAARAIRAAKTDIDGVVKVSVVPEAGANVQLASRVRRQRIVGEENSHS